MQTIRILILSLYLVGCFIVFCYKYRETKRCTLKAIACITIKGSDICYSAYNTDGKHINTSSNYRPLWRRPNCLNLWVNPDDPVEFVYTKSSHWIFALKCLVWFAILYLYLYCW